jgi:uncharacterized protein YbjT (DUF2867 family)
MSRHPERADLPCGVEVLRGDLEQPSTLASALDGVERVFLMGPTPQLASYANHLCCQSRLADVRHVVLLSSSIVELAAADELSVAHRHAEDAITRSALAWTFLRPGAFMSNALAWADALRASGEVRGLVGDFPSAPIDPADIAATAAQVLRSDAHFGGVYPLTGPEPLRPSQQVAILGELLHRTLRFDQLSEPEALAELVGSRTRQQAAALMASLRRPDVPWADPVPTVERIAGRKPTTFRAWATRHLKSFR